MAIELPADGSSQAPGRYTRSGFEPTITFEVGAGWVAEQAAAGFFDVEQEPGSLDVIAVQFANVVGPTSAAEAVSEIASQSNLEVTDPEPVEVDGRSGIRVVVETTDPADTDPPIFWPVLAVPAGPLSIASARRLQVTLVDVHGGVLAILVGGSIAQWERTLKLASPIVDSVTIPD